MKLASFRVYTVKVDLSSVTVDFFLNYTKFNVANKSLHGEKQNISVKIKPTVGVKPGTCWCLL